MTRTHGVTVHDKHRLKIDPRYKIVVDIDKTGVTKPPSDSPSFHDTEEEFEAARESDSDPAPSPMFHVREFDALTEAIKREGSKKQKDPKGPKKDNDDAEGF